MKISSRLVAFVRTGSFIFYIDIFWNFLTPLYIHFILKRYTCLPCLWYFKGCDTFGPHTHLARILLGQLFWASEFEPQTIGAKKPLSPTILGKTPNVATLIWSNTRGMWLKCECNSNVPQLFETPPTTFSLRMYILNYPLYCWGEKILSLFLKMRDIMRSF